jgi:hypothetical protein
MFISSILSTNGSGMAGPRSCATYVRFIITNTNNKMLNTARMTNVLIYIFCGFFCFYERGSECLDKIAPSP